MDFFHRINKKTVSCQTIVLNFPAVTCNRFRIIFTRCDNQNTLHAYPTLFYVIVNYLYKKNVSKISSEV